MSTCIIKEKKCLTLQAQPEDHLPRVSQPVSICDPSFFYIKIICGPSLFYTEALSASSSHVPYRSCVVFVDKLWATGARIMYTNCETDIHIMELSDHLETLLKKKKKQILQHQTHSDHFHIYIHIQLKWATYFTTQRIPYKTGPLLQ